MLKNTAVVLKLKGQDRDKESSAEYTHLEAICPPKGKLI